MIMAPFKDININIIIKEPYENAITNMPASLLLTYQYLSLITQKKDPSAYGVGLLVITFLASLSSFMLVTELTVIQVRIEAALRQQLLMGSLLDNAALVHDQNQVRIPDRG